MFDYLDRTTPAELINKTSGVPVTDLSRPDPTRTEQNDSGLMYQKVHPSAKAGGRWAPLSGPGASHMP